MLFKKKKEEPHKGDILLAKGIYLKQPVLENGSVLKNCFLRSIIVFCLTFGAIGGFLSAFRMSYNYLLVIFFYMLLSLYFSFLYSTAKLLLRDIGYIVFFALFVGAIFVLRLYANSGFYTVVNQILQQAKTFFNLSGVRAYETQIDNDYLTVAIVAIFIGMVLIIVLNIWLSSSMSLFWAILLTFPLQLIPIYMKLTPDPFYVIILMIGYVAVVVFKANGHYIAFAWDSSFRAKGLKKNRVTYSQDASVFSQVLMSLAIFAFVLVLLVEAVFPGRMFESRFKNDPLREATSDTIGNFVLLGLSGMMNRYSATGGLSAGKLGGVSNVRPDYQTDLVVSYAPYSTQPIYLKGYTGGIYGDNQWETVYDEENSELTGENKEIYEEETLQREAEILVDAFLAGEERSGIGRIDVQNVGANTNFMYYPYYTQLRMEDAEGRKRPGEMGAGIRTDSEASYLFSPQLSWDGIGEVVPSEIDLSMVDPVYLDVPEKNKEVIHNECEKIGLNSDMTENEIVDAVDEYFEANIPYTLRPGATPKDADFINYFLTENRKGYCAHFASAATLLFREMGIPARYVEGYAFSFEAALASDENELKEYDDYYKGFSPIGASTVLDVEVTDAMAHAWVEVYMEGFGWKVVEMTPGSNEETEEEDFWSSFTNFLSNPVGADASDGGANVLGDLNLSQFSWLIYVVLGIILLLILLYIIGIAIRKFRRYRLCHQKDAREAVIAFYADTCNMIRTCDKTFDHCRSHMEQLDYMERQYALEFEKENLCKEIERISFSRENAENAEIEKIRTFVDEARKKIRKSAKFGQRVKLWKR